jgi:site-specific DNA-methyltransferase (adenine-specific)
MVKLLVLYGLKFLDLATFVYILVCCGYKSGYMNSVVFKSESYEWATPPAIFQALDKEFHFDFDPCPLGGTEDGRSPLFCKWEGKRVFCNPPYGPEIVKFLKRAHDAQLSVFLLPARTDTKWFHELVLPLAKEIRFIKGRLKFGNAANCAPFPSMVVVFEQTVAPAAAMVTRVAT